MIAGIKDVFYCASDMDRSVAFYRRLLGCEPRFASEYWTEFGVGGATFGIHWSEGRPIVPSDPVAHGPVRPSPSGSRTSTRPPPHSGSGASRFSGKSTGSPGETGSRSATRTETL